MSQEIKEEDIPKSFGVVQRKISGDSGQGECFIIENANLGRFLMKVFKETNVDRSTEASQRFDREVNILKSCTQCDIDGVPKYIDSGNFECSKGVMNYIVMEYVSNSKSLDKYLDGFKKGLPSIGEVFAFFSRLMGILKDCHTLGIIHRDIKPRNIVLADKILTRPFLVDFGISFTDDDKSITDTQGEPFNAFFELPELKNFSARQLRADDISILKRHPTIDTTQACGVLLHVLFGTPRGLSCDNFLLNEKVQKGLRTYEGNYPDMKRFFVKALNSDKAARFQSVDDLEYAFKSMTSNIGVTMEALQRRIGALEFNEPPSPGTSTDQTWLSLKPLLELSFSVAKFKKERKWLMAKEGRQCNLSYATDSSFIEIEFSVRVEGRLCYLLMKVGGKGDEHFFNLDPLPSENDVAFGLLHQLERCLKKN